MIYLLTITYLYGTYEKYSRIALVSFAREIPVSYPNRLYGPMKYSWASSRVGWLNGQ